MERTDSHLLVADEDAAVRGQICEYLGRHEFRVTAVDTGQRMLEIIAHEPIDLLLLEPRLHGVSLTHSIRDSSKLPIVVLTDLTEEADRVMGLEFGADDYVTKPFSPRELLARIRAVLRRTRVPEPAPSGTETLRAYRFAGWELNVRLHRLQSPSGERVPISRSEFSLLCAFLSRPNRILTRDQLLEFSRLHSTEVYDRAIDVQVMRLRRKIQTTPAQPQLIRTQRSAGYFLDTAVQAVR